MRDREAEIAIERDRDREIDRKKCNKRRIWTINETMKMEPLPLPEDCHWFVVVAGCFFFVSSSKRRI